MDAAERVALTALCSELPELRRVCDRMSPDAVRALDEIVRLAQGRRPILARLTELVGPDTTRGLATGLPGGLAGRADEERFGCPDGECGHIATTVPAGPVPVCPVTGSRMRRL